MPAKPGRSLILISCACAIFWPGAFIFGFPGVLSPHWQQVFNVGGSEVGRTVFFVPTGDFFGMANFGAIFGLIFTAYGFLSGPLSPWLSGYILDLTQDNYTLVFSYLGLMYLASNEVGERIIFFQGLTRALPQLILIFINRYISPSKKQCLDSLASPS